MKILYYDRGTAEDKVGLEYLSSLVRTEPTDFHLVYVTQEFSEMDDEKRRGLAKEQSSQKQESSSGEAFCEAREILRADNLTISTLARSGDPVEEINQIVERDSFDLLAISAFGRGGFASDVLGAHAKQLLDNIEIPIIIHKGQLDACERVLVHVPVQERRCTRFCNYLATLLKSSAPTVTLLSIIEEESPKFKGYTSGDIGLRDALENYDKEELKELKTLEIAQGILDKSGIETNLRYRKGNLTTELLREAKEGRYDLLAFAPQQPGLLASVWKGSNSLEVMRDVEISVLRYQITD